MHVSTCAGCRCELHTIVESTRRESLVSERRESPQSSCLCCPCRVLRPALCPVTLVTMAQTQIRPCGLRTARHELSPFCFDIIDELRSLIRRCTSSRPSFGTRRSTATSAASSGSSPFFAACKPAWLPTTRDAPQPICKSGTNQKQNPALGTAAASGHQKPSTATRMCESRRPDPRGSSSSADQESEWTKQKPQQTVAGASCSEKKVAASCMRRSVSLSVSGHSNACYVTR